MLRCPISSGGLVDVFNINFQLIICFFGCNPSVLPITSFKYKHSGPVLIFVMFQLVYYVLNISHVFFLQNADFLPMSQTEALVLLVLPVWAGVC